MEENKKNTGFLVGIIILIIILVGGLFLITSNLRKKQTSDDKKDSSLVDTSKNNEEKKDLDKSTDSIQSILLQNGEKLDYRYEDVEYKILFKKDDEKTNIIINDKEVFSNSENLGMIQNVYVIGDILMYEKVNSDATLSTSFINFNGKNLLTISSFDNEENFLTTQKATVTNNSITFKTLYGGYGIIDDEAYIKNDGDVYREYTIDYLGDYKFSDLTLKTAKKYSEAICKKDDNGISHCE